MAQKVLTWSNSQLNNSRCNFHVPCLFFVLYMYSVRIHFGCERCDNTCVGLYMIYNYMLRMALLDRIRGWFYYVL